MTILRMLIFVALLFLTPYISAQEYPEAVGWVNDFAEVISPEYENKLTNLITEVENKTTAEIAIATVKTTGMQSIDMYAVELFTRWGIGKKDKDNGVLIVAAIADRKVWIAVGYGLEGVLPDGLCGEIYRSVLKPNFRQGEFGKGLFLATTIIANKIGKEYNVEITGAEEVHPIRDDTPPMICGLLGPLIFILLLLLLFSRLGFWGLLPLMVLGSRRGYWGSGTFGGSGGFGGGFGGFGGGSCGGGGAGGSW